MRTHHTYTSKNLPPWIRKALVTSTEFKELCSGAVTQGDVKHAITFASHIMVSTEKTTTQPDSSSRKRRVCAFIILLDHHFQTTNDGDPHPVCKSNEWYIDVICSRCKGEGKALLQYLYRKAFLSGIQQIRLYSVPKAFSFWKHQGYMECEDGCNSSGCARKSYQKEPTERRMVYCLPIELSAKGNPTLNLPGQRKLYYSARNQKKPKR
jgi:hypothetical protein